MRATREKHARNMQVFPAPDHTALAPFSPSLMGFALFKFMPRLWSMNFQARGGATFETWCHVGLNDSERTVWDLEICGLERYKIGVTRNGHGLHKQIVTRFVASTPPTTSYFLHFWWLHNDLNTSGFESQRPEFLNIENWWSYKPHNIKKLNFILTTSFRVLNLLEWFSFFCLWIFGSLYNTHVAKHVISRWAKRKACLAKKD